MWAKKLFKQTQNVQYHVTTRLKLFQPNSQTSLTSRELHCQSVQILTGEMFPSFVLTPRLDSRSVNMCVSDGYNPKSRTHRSMLLCLLMTSCDLSDQTKGWKTTRKIAVSSQPTPTSRLNTDVAESQELFRLYEDNSAAGNSLVWG